MKSATEWLKAFFPKHGGFTNTAGCDLAYSMRDGATSLAVVQALLRHPSELLRGSVAWALWESGNAQGTFLPAIFTGIQDSSAEVRYWCASALERVRDDHKTESILRLLPLLVDPAYRVRDVAIDRIHVLGRAHFEIALETRPDVFALRPETVALVDVIQRDLREGYARFSRSVCRPQFSEPLDGLAELGYSIHLSYHAAEFVDALRSTLPQSSPDVRYSLARRLQGFIETAVDTIRFLSDDSESRCRARSWSALSGLMLEVRKWQKLLPNATRDGDMKVREACLYHLGWAPVPDPVPTVVSACRGGDDATRREALRALDTFVWAAQSIQAIDEDTLRGFLGDLDDPTVSMDVRGGLLTVLHGFAKLFTHECPKLDWATILGKVNGEAKRDGSN